MRRREYLKYKKWKQIHKYAEVDDSCYAPKRQSMRFSAKEGNSNWVPYRLNIWYSDKISVYWSKLNKFLERHVGKSFDKTYTEFREKFPDHIGKIDFVKEFHARFLKNHSKELNNLRCSRYWSFYVDKYGIIRDLWKETLTQKDKKRELEVISKTKTYRFSSNVFKYSRAFEIIKEELPHKWRAYLDPNQIITEAEFKKILECLDNIRCRIKLASLFSEKDWKQIDNYYPLEKYRFDWDPNTWRYTKSVNGLTTNALKRFIFTETIVKDSLVVEAGSTEHRRYLENQRKKNASEYRKSKKEQELARENLLYDIEDKRKSELHKTDIIDRDRLGFDENSFIGEFYHGQKRKKRNN